MIAEINLSTKRERAVVGHILRWFFDDSDDTCEDQKKLMEITADQFGFTVDDIRVGFENLSKAAKQINGELD